MRLCNFIVRDAIIPSLAAPVPHADARDLAAVGRVKEAVVREMVGALHAAGHFRATDVDEIVKAVLRREQLGTTGIGRHIAIPHSRHPAVDRLIGTMALSRDGLPFDSLDGEPVYVFVLLVSPQDRPGDHLRALEAVVRTMRNDDFVRQLRAGQTREEIWALLETPRRGGEGGSRASRLPNLGAAGRPHHKQRQRVAGVGRRRPNWGHGMTGRSGGNGPVQRDAIPAGACAPAPPDAPPPDARPSVAEGRDGPVRRVVRIVNPLGLHFRVADRFSRTANQYACNVTVWNGPARADGKSLWDLITLVALPDSEVVIEVDGPDAPKAVDPLADILAAAGGEDYTV